jgi:hypothetical protein
MSFLFGGGGTQVVDPGGTETVTPDLQLPIPLQVLQHYLLESSGRQLAAMAPYEGQRWTDYFPKVPLGGGVQIPGMHQAAPGYNGYPTWGGNAYSSAPGGIGPSGGTDFAALLSAPGSGLIPRASMSSQYGEDLGGFGPRPGAPQPSSGAPPVNTTPAPPPQNPQWPAPMPVPQPSPTPLQQQGAAQTLAQAGVDRIRIGGQS